VTPRGADIEPKLERFILGELIEDRYDGRDPLAAELIDSLGLEQLVEYIEEEFGVTIEDQEMIRKNFESVAVLAALVSAKREAASA
jgi:acyl carrier protein